jgi:hypothetical protein
MMLSSYPFWWLALPVLLLPIWWHRQKRQRLKAEPLATARFLPSAAPEQLRVWQWRDRLLLLVRCLMLVALIAWLAATIFPWRGDTVLVDAGADKAWTEQQITAASMSAAQRAELPATGQQGSHGLQWLREHERDWRPGARLLAVARADQIAMPARVPQFSHQVELRTRLSPVAAAGPVQHRVVLTAVAERAAAWRSLFTAFDRAGTGASRYVMASEPDANTELIVWDSPDAPPANWRAPHWWIAAPSTAAFPELARAPTLVINGITLKYIDSPRGRLWASDAWPARDADTARAVYDAWQLLAASPAPAYPTQSQTFGAARSALPAITDAKPATWLALALLALFALERILTHARRN